MHTYVQMWGIKKAVVYEIDFLLKSFAFYCVRRQHICSLVKCYFVMNWGTRDNGG